MFNDLLIILAKIGLSLIVIFFVLRWFIIIPYLWFKYDKKILKLKNGLNEFRNEQRLKPITQLSIDGSIQQKTLIVNEKLEIIETQRKLFIDRVNLFLSISSINKS
ncbi:MAG: hypothetical protein Q7K54_04395 [Candidatus Parcubacteria bacterium]|nr:hypothetical protein [Candidatus Parcubacteria bacterium]